MKLRRCKDTPSCLGRLLNSPLPSSAFWHSLRPVHVCRQAWSRSCFTSLWSWMHSAMQASQVQGTCHMCRQPMQAKLATSPQLSCIYQPQLKVLCRMGLMSLHC